MVLKYRDRSKKQYAKNLFGIASIGLGAFFIIEHIYTWGSFQVKDIIGHEWLGLLLVAVGILINLDFKTPWSSELKTIFSKIYKR